MGMTTLVVLTCDRCGASVTGNAPAGSSRFDVTMLNAERPPTRTYYCPSCTEAIIGVATTPPR